MTYLVVENIIEESLEHIPLSKNIKLYYITIK